MSSQRIYQQEVQFERTRLHEKLDINDVCCAMAILRNLEQLLGNTDESQYVHKIWGHILTQLYIST